LQPSVTIRNVFHLDGTPTEAADTDLPGIPGAKAQVLAVSPSDGSVVLRLRGVSKNPQDVYRAATRESLSVDVTHKPMIALVWAGFYVMMAGALLALVKRSREASRAVAAIVEPRAEPRSESPAGYTAPGPPPVPLHTRSRI
jgi:hypothetical protein